MGQHTLNTLNGGKHCFGICFFLLTISILQSTVKVSFFHIGCFMNKFHLNALRIEHNIWTRFFYPKMQSLDFFRTNYSNGDAMKPNQFFRAQVVQDGNENGILLCWSHLWKITFELWLMIHLFPVCSCVHLLHREAFSTFPQCQHGKALNSLHSSRLTYSLIDYH